MLPGLDRNVQTAADLLVSVLEGAERRLSPEDAVRWMLISLGPEERIPSSIQELVLQTCADERVRGRGGTRALMDLCPRLGDRHPELREALQAWCCGEGPPSGWIRGNPVWSVGIRHRSGRPAAWRDAGHPVWEVIGDRQTVLVPLGEPMSRDDEGDLWWSGGGTLTLDLEAPAFWSPDPMVLVRRGVVSDVRATTLEHGDLLARGDVQLRFDRRPLQERVLEVVGDVPALAALLPGLSPTLQLLAGEAARWPRREVPPRIEELLGMPMEAPVRALLLIRGSWSFHRISAYGVQLGALDPDVPLMEKDGRGPHADTFRTGTRPDAFFLGRESERGRWLFVHGEGRVAYLHTEDARGYRMQRPPAALEPG